VQPIAQLVKKKVYFPEKKFLSVIFSRIIFIDFIFHYNFNMTQNKNENHTALTHYTAAFIGGFLGLFPLVNAIHLFGSAQTSNLIGTVTSIIDTDFQNLLFHFFGILLFSISIFLATFLSKHSNINLKILSMAVDSVAAFFMAYFPTEKNLPLIFYLYPTFFALSFHWCAFPGCYGFTCATIFSTNNLRQFISAITELFFNSDKSFSLKAKFFGLTLLFFHIGVCISYILWKFLGNKGFLCAILPCFLLALSETIMGISKNCNF